MVRMLVHRRAPWAIRCMPLVPRRPQSERKPPGRVRLRWESKLCASQGRWPGVGALWWEASLGRSSSHAGITCNVGVASRQSWREAIQRLCGDCWVLIGNAARLSRTLALCAMRLVTLIARPSPPVLFSDASGLAALQGSSAYPCDRANEGRGSHACRFALVEGHRVLRPSCLIGMPRRSLHRCTGRRAERIRPVPRLGE